MQGAVAQIIQLGAYLISHLFHISSTGGTGVDMFSACCEHRSL